MFKKLLTFINYLYERDYFTFLFIVYVSDLIIFALFGQPVLILLVAFIVMSIALYRIFKTLTKR